MTTYQTASPIVQESVGGDGLPNRGFLTAGILPMRQGRTKHKQS